jgi:hypothetical protein
MNKRLMILGLTLIIALGSTMGIKKQVPLNPLLQTAIETDPTQHAVKLSMETDPSPHVIKIAAETDPTPHAIKLPLL